MDSEKGLTPAPSKASRSNCCRNVLLAIAITTGTIALALSACTLALQITSHQELRNGHLPQYTEKQEQRILHQVAQYLHDSEYNETANRVARSTSCSSSHDSTLTVKPSAHIAGKSFGASNIHLIKTFFETRIPILSAGWSCDKGRNGHVLGGMKYNSKNGFLRVPVEGIYFLYSQILLNITSHDGPSTKLGHMTVRCECKDESNDCYCYSMEKNLAYTNPGNDMDGDFMRSYTTWNKGSAGGSKYQGGLFHLTAGDYIAVVPVTQDNPDNDPNLSIIARDVDSFFGAYYVTGLKAPVATPTPSPSL
ncbi:PREDICTED: uncharacterized protein LOC109585650 [Amphimedon queenslandica]|uniref:THD domain-containing protein n=1 Tax=Amphimedon queenslandica TaxID=400682 RepID=A0A1X7VQI5_AMPQE|nr:PREDICTED: uncharacterized protein LOC109585650 [Amphimedon queenslandica]XP_019857351.1 PREDICTED: uncharacterized protein LOC109585650 [Amphimedon queenslandica]XP_019857355.1 PREDICTED: uncharacterized protein LOC109585650 [Amphimedon queenslandica]|eukprot:XP_019857348.1 PREDICTED: uncharacterized protein LOC109585650 [Amphimedon queenslandica]